MNFVIVGSNFISDTFLMAAQQVAEFDFYGICSRKKSTAQTFIKKNRYNKPVKIFLTLHDVCSDPQVDAVYIASPNHLHASQAIQCLQAKKHVLGEKPSAANLRELQEVFAAAQTNNCLYMEAFMTSYLPNFQRLKNNLPRLGKIRKFHGRFEQYSSRYDAYLKGNIPNWCRLDYANGALVDIGIYPLALILALWGNPDHIMASAIKLATGVDAAGDMLLTYKQTTTTKQAMINYSKITQGSNISEFQGELGRIEIKEISQLKHMTLILNDGTKEVISLPFEPNIMQYELISFIEEIKNFQPKATPKSQGFSELLMSVMQQVRQQLNIVYPSDCKS
ncbi:MAG: Gfo/Idh/MocA family oxidoreductase [Alteromonadaceae bacterium]|nr:Gfo/Idh/MocA family oxidoreductase [Alteromonadaceae bacterium]